MNQNFLAGTLAIVAGIMVLYRYCKYYKAKKGIIVQTLIITMGICILISGCIGIYKNALDGINVLIFGIVWYDYMRRSPKADGGDVSGMHTRGWIAAIGAIIAGILLILDHLNIFSLWREM